MLLRSDVLALRSEMKCRLATFAWLLAAAMAALSAAPAAAHADMVSYSDGFSYYIGSTDPFAGNRFNFNLVTSNGSAFVMPPDYSVQKLASSSSGRYNPSTHLITWTDGSATYNYSATTFADGLLYKPNAPSGFMHFTTAYTCASPVLGAGSRFTFSTSRFVIGSGYAVTGYFRVAVANHDGSEFVECSRTGNGMYEVPESVPFEPYFVICDCQFSSSPDSGGRLWFARSQLSVQYSDESITGAIDHNTDAIKDLANTNGSSDIASGALGGAQSALDQHMSFMEQVDALAGHFTSISADSDSSVTFPGIDFGEFKLPPAKVDIWEHMGALETPCKTICTGVFIFAWFNGMRALYGRIFHDEKDVILD